MSGAQHDFRSFLFGNSLETLIVEQKAMSHNSTGNSRSISAQAAFRILLRHAAYLELYRDLNIHI